MYKNIGKKLKTLASIVGIGGSGLSLLIGIFVSLASCSGGGRGYYQGYSDDVSEGVMWLFIFLGIAVVCFISSWVLYGFGQLIESTQNIENKILGKQPLSQYASKQQATNIIFNNTMHNCPKCGTSNTNDSKFCVKCGEKLN